MSLSGSLFLSFFPSRRELRCQICRQGGSLRENYSELNCVGKAPRFGAFKLVLCFYPLMTP